MSMKFTRIPASTYQTLQLNAGIIASDFTCATGTVNASDILGATSGGVTFTDKPTFVDFGEDIDNCPKNSMELRRISSRTVTLKGTFKTVNTSLAKKLIAGCTEAAGKITPVDILSSADFRSIWWIGDYSDKNGASCGGFIAINLLNALSTGGFSIKSADGEKGSFAFEFTAHYSIAQPDTVPYAMYIVSGTDEPANEPENEPENNPAA